MVTALGGGSFGTQILRALRLAEHPYHIVGCDISSQSATLAMSDTPYLVPPCTDSRYVDTLIALCHRHDVQALFPGCESEILRLARERSRFEAANTLLVMQPDSVLETCMDKSKTVALLEAKGFASPASEEITSIAQAEAFPHLPAVLKPITGSGGSVDVYVVQSRQEMLAFAAIMLHSYPKFLAQAYVGCPDDEYTVGVLTDHEGQLINSIAMRRHILSPLSNRLKVPNRSGRSDLGPVLAISNGISQGDIGRFPSVTGPCEELALALGCRGALNIQCRLVDDVVTVFEINPRFSGTTSLRAMVGYNEPDVLLARTLRGATISRHFEYEEGHIGRHLDATLVQQGGFAVATPDGVAGEQEFQS